VGYFAEFFFLGPCESIEQDGASKYREDSLLASRGHGNRILTSTNDSNQVSDKRMARTRCNDHVVGAILASWRYDISGISPEMRRDYEQHFTDCPHCRGRLKFHRSLDVSLAVLTSLAVLFFLFALAVLQHTKPLEHVAFNVLRLDISDMFHMLMSAGVAGLAFSIIALTVVLTATPAPSYLSDIASERAKYLEEHLPEAIRSLRSR